jgi:light-regulated signal transduction histidine kinase (bacteriophytochrome)
MNKVQIQDCADEPITIPGVIQSHGLLFVLHTETFVIEQVSENSLELLGKPAETLLGMDARDLVTKECTESFERLVKEAAENYVNPFQVDVMVIDGPSLRCNGIANSIEKDITLLEFEPLALSETGTESLENYFQLVQNSLQLSSNFTDMRHISELMAQKVKFFTGFDRVMIYRFSEDGSGQVIAEEKEEGMEPFLNLRYPASDIPAQARELYLKNWVRLVLDVDAKGAAILPIKHPRLNAPTPLDKSVLREVSPIHLQYLRNMGVQSTLTISLVVGNQLWGLIACHHRTPRFVSYGIRATSSLYGVVMSAQLERAENAKRSLEQVASEQAIAKFLSRLDPNLELETNFSQSLPVLMDIFKADGAALLSRENSLTEGSCPPVEILRNFISKLENGNDDSVVISDEVGCQFPELSSLLPQAAGLIAFPLSHEYWLIILRDEYQDQISWGGSPNSAKVADSKGRLQPRESFKEWVEEVKGRSKPWPDYVSLLVDELRSGMTGFVISQNRILETTNEELHRFASVVAHEVKSQLQPPLLALSILNEQPSNDKLKTMLELGITSLTTLSEFTTEMLSFAQLDNDYGDVTEVDLGKVARQAAEQAAASLISHPVETIFHQLPKQRVSPSQSHHLFLNLIRNAIIHGPLDGQEDFKIEIGCQETSVGKCCFFVRDNGRGIPKEDQEQIFEYFRRGSGENQRKGSGIGLGFARRMLSRNGGKIWVESELGKGSTFLFTMEES